jgi:UDP-N-acetyl-alpha-D-muramoyl-L-alanyl-L-glutamate epimerase
LDVTLFSVGDAPPIRETARVSGYERLMVTRRIDPLLLERNAAGALNGHIPITAIVSCVALLTAALNGQDAVTLANERSASAGNLTWHGIEVNHQFSKGRKAERLLADAAAEIPNAPAIFSVLRPASELSIARAFSRFEQYHPVFTSCNRVFQIDPAKRLTSWCCDCDKCRFVFLILAPFMTPAQLTKIFGADLLEDVAQYEGFALLTATGGDKPFECVGEVEEVLTAIHLLASDPKWSDHPVVARLATEVLSAHTVTESAVHKQFVLSDDHDVPDELAGAVRAVLGA